MGLGNEPSLLIASLRAPVPAPCLVLERGPCFLPPVLCRTCYVSTVSLQLIFPLADLPLLLLPHPLLSPHSLLRMITTDLRAALPLMLLSRQAVHLSGFLGNSPLGFLAPSDRRIPTFSGAGPSLQVAVHGASQLPTRLCLAEDPQAEACAQPVPV